MDAGGFGGGGEGLPGDEGLENVLLYDESSGKSLPTSRLRLRANFPGRVRLVGD